MSVKTEMEGCLPKMMAWLETRRGDETTLMPLKARGKSPLYAHASMPSCWTSKELWEFIKREPEHGTWGLLLDRLCVVDADDAETVSWLEEMGASGEIPELARCPCQATRKGRHYVFARPLWADEEGYWDGARHSLRQVDLKTQCSTGTMGVLVVAPSEGKAWLPGRAPWEVPELEAMPRSLMELVAKPRSKRVAAASCRPAATTAAATAAAAATATATTAQSSREVPKDYVTRLLELLSKMRWEERRTWRDIATALKNEHGERYRSEWERLSRSSSKWDAAEASKLWTTVSRGGDEGPRLTTRTLSRWAREDDPVGYRELRGEVVPELVLESWDKGDRGLADIAHHLLGGVLKRVGSRGDIYYFSEEKCRWYKGDEGSVHRRVSIAVEESLQDVASRLARQTTASSGEADDGGVLRRAEETRRQRVAERIAYVRKKAGMSAVTALAVRMCQDDGFEQLLDAVPHLLGVANGVVDLRTGELRDRVPEDMIYTVLETRYEATADSSDVERMVLDCMAGNGGKAAFIKRMLGYGITGDVSEEIFVIFTGTGRNGKGGITQTLSRVLGGFYKAMNSGLICERQVSNIDAERGKLLGARLAVFDELKDGKKLRTQEVQLISGSDGIPARPLYKDPITIDPRHLCILATNHMPELSHVLASIVLRVLVVHFPVTFVDLLPNEAPSEFRRQKDPALKARLAGNPEGVLRWLVEGAVEWYAAPGLRRSAPAEVLEYSRQYFAEQDRLGKFLEERCRIGGDLKVATSELLEMYNAENKDARMSAAGMTAAMRSKGFDKRLARVHGGGPMQCFVGLEMRGLDYELTEGPLGG